LIASLGMYDRAETGAANDRFWTLIADALRARGIAAPNALTRGDGAYWRAWSDPDLVLSQTCGFPYRSRLHGSVRLIGTPDYGLAGCPPGHYRSVLIARKGDQRPLSDFADARFAYNEALSQSGWAAPQNHVAGLGFQFTNTLATGAHRLSVKSVVEGRADLAAVDAQTWSMITRWDHDALLLREVDHTVPTPGLPLIARLGADRALYLAALTEAVNALSEDDRETLSLRGIVSIPAEAYLQVPTPPPPEQIEQPA
jgi:ABC-type phosphate/phosphonate transport system substrate-binding protein